MSGVQSLGELASSEEESGLWRAFKAGQSAGARQKLFSRYTRFAQNIARRHYNERSRGDIEIEDLYQLAYAGLLEALDRFDIVHGAPFRSFAARRISGSIADGVERSSEMREQLAWRARLRRERIRSLSDASQAGASQTEKLVGIATGLALGFMLEDMGLLSPGDALEVAQRTAYETLAWKEVVQQLQLELASLPERDQAILREHYGNGVGFNQLALLFGISKGRVAQLHRAALSLLRKRMREQGHGKMVR